MMRKLTDAERDWLDVGLRIWAARQMDLNDLPPPRVQVMDLETAMEEAREMIELLGGDEPVLLRSRRGRLLLKFDSTHGFMIDEQHTAQPNPGQSRTRLKVV